MSKTQYQQAYITKNEDNTFFLKIADTDGKPFNAGNFASIEDAEKFAIEDAKSVNAECIFN